MYFKKILFFVIAIFIGTIAHAQVKSTKQILEEAKSKIMITSVDELKMKMDAEEKFILIDIRTEKEYLSGHIENAIWISRGKLEFTIQKISKDPMAEIIIYCRGGSRSALSVCALNNIGYENVLNLEGGFKKWVTSGNSAYNMHGEIKVINFERKEKKKD